MRNSLLTLALILTLARAGAAQDTARQLVIPLPGAGFVGFRLDTARDAAQPLPVGADELQWAIVPQALLDERNTIHRVLLDGEGNVIFGYDLVVEPSERARQFKVSVNPLSAQFEQQLRARRAGARPAAPVPTLPRPAAPQTLDDGDAFTLDLLVNPQTGVRVVDVVKVAFDRARLWQAAPRDFTLDSVEMAVRDHRLLLNGALVAGGRAARGASGALLWFYVPGRGRFILSLVPRAGYDFRKVALVEGNRISFDFRGDRYEWVSSAPVVGSGGDWHAWLLHDPDYTPEVASAEQITRQILKKDESEPEEKTSGDWIKDVLAGRKPHRGSSQADYERKAREADRKQPAERVRIGAADRIENLLPKK